MWEMGNLFRSHTSNFSANIDLKEFTQVGDTSGHHSRFNIFWLFWVVLTKCLLFLSRFSLPFAFPFPFRCAEPTLSAAAALVQSKTTIVFGRPLPGLHAFFYSAFCLLCRPAKLASSGGRNGRFIINNGAHWKSQLSVI
jgi:hypothetical protein